MEATLDLLPIYWFEVLFLLNFHVFVINIAHYILLYQRIVVQLKV